MFVLVTGANGQLGKSLNRLVNQNITDYRFVFSTRDELDLTNFKYMRGFIEKNQFDVIINCAAFTAVDKSELEKENANRVNHLAVKNIAEIARDNCIKLIHISTDYVFDGAKGSPYDEDNAKSPLNYYGHTKSLSEDVVAKSGCKYIVFRISWLYSLIRNNFVLTMLNLAKNNRSINLVSDQFGNPTCVITVAKLTNKVCRDYVEKNFWPGIYHLSDFGNCSRIEFAECIFSHALQLKLIDRKPDILPVKTCELNSAAQRPLDTRLNIQRVQMTFDVPIPNWDDQVHETMRHLADKVKND